MSQCIYRTVNHYRLTKTWYMYVPFELGSIIKHWYLIYVLV